MSTKYTSNDFKSDQEVKWCPGCGDYAILAAVQRALPEVAEQRGYEKSVLRWFPELVVLHASLIT